MPVGQIPTGTVTLLFTDIEGSTKLWESHPEIMRVSLARHDAILRATIGASKGYVFKTIGDAFCAAFATATEAVEAVLAAQIAIAAEPWPKETPIRVRVSLHTGAVESREDDYFGPPVNRVARLLSVAHGGQVVLSAATQELVRDTLPPGSMLRILGEHRLKDLGRPETVFQLLHEALPDDFAPLRSLDNAELRHNLPQQVTSFIGREKELSDIRSILSKTRLLTLTGSGGSGKTRLALQVAADLLDGSGNGVWLVELAQLSDASLVPQAVANALGLQEEPGQPIERTLVRHLASKSLLLVLDNCEHVLDACSALADAIHRGCPQVSILATSREVLGIAGETTYRVPSLTLPDPRCATTPDYLGQFEAVQLFMERAVQVQTTFTVTNDNAAALASICQRLDGIPLAIELAAARVRSLTIEDIHSKLDQRFRLLTGGLRTALPRQQTLRSMIDWSYDLLKEPERTLLSRLSVFAGGWTLEAAESVCSDGALVALDILDLLDSLCEKSLVVSESQGPSSRYRLLETVRQYAADRLSETGESETSRERHRAWCLALAERGAAELLGSQPEVGLCLLDLEIDNLREALEWCVKDSGGGETGLSLCAVLYRYWDMRGYLSEGQNWCAMSLAHAGAQERTTARACALNGSGVLARAQGEYAKAQSLHEQALTLSRALQDWTVETFCLNSLGTLASDQGDLASARSLFEQSLELNRAQGDRRREAIALGNLAIIALDQSELARARILLEQALVLNRESGNRAGEANTLGNLGLVSNALGEVANAIRFHGQELEILRDLNISSGIPGCLEGLAAAECLEQPIRAAQLWGAADAFRQEVGRPLPPVEQEDYHRLVGSARESVGEESFDVAWAKGCAMTLEEAIAYALDA